MAGGSGVRHDRTQLLCRPEDKADVDFSGFMLYAKEDTNTRCIAPYIEGPDSPEAFTDACRSIVADKPTAVIKVGGSRLGAKAAMRQPASENTGTDEAEFEKAGAIRLESWLEFPDVSMALALQPLADPGECSSRDLKTPNRRRDAGRVEECSFLALEKPFG
jgi:acyl-CoA synthetase (NDP forming)